MRQLVVLVPEGCGSKVMDIASEHGAVNMFSTNGRDQDGARDVVTVHLGNARVEKLLPALEDVPDLKVVLQPRGILALRPPADEAADQAIDIEPRSAIEVFLSGLQSIGSWPGFLGYAAAGGVVVWIGLFTETIFLLTAAMLIAPFAAPAMNAALATARGDLYLFGRSIARYFAALAVTILATFLLSLAMQQKIATGLMIDQSLIPSVAVLLPLVAGAAGALNLCQSDRSSLVSGAATGVLVAASLAPPAGIVGMAIALGEWRMATGGIFLLLLQISGINVAGALVFRFFRVSPGGGRYPRGRKSVSVMLWLGSLAALGALLTWQFSTSPNLLRSTVSQRAAEEVRDAISNSGLAKAVQVQTQFTRANISGQNTLLVTAYVQSGQDERVVRRQLSASIKQRLSRKYDDVYPLVDVTVLEP